MRGFGGVFLWSGFAGLMVLAAIILVYRPQHVDRVPKNRGPLASVSQEPSIAIPDAGFARAVDTSPSQELGKIGRTEVAQQGKEQFESSESKMADDELKQRVSELVDIWTAENTSDALQKFHRLIRELPDGDTKEEVSRLAAKLRGPEMMPDLLAALLSEDDPMVVRSAKMALTKGADEETVNLLVRLYDDSQDTFVRQRIESVFRAMQSIQAAGAMITYVNDTANLPLDPLGSAILAGLANVRTPPAAAAVLRRLDLALPAENTGELVGMVMSINAPEAFGPLENAALGRKGIASYFTRAAATVALRNYPGVQTTALLKKLATDTNSIVRMAAVETLDLMAGRPIVAKPKKGAGS